MVRLIWLVGALSIVGCAESPPDQCNDLINDFCNRGVMCIGGISQTTCVQEVQQTVPCGKAVKIGPSYDSCIDEINMDACNILFPTDPNTGQPTTVLPADCQGVILTQ